MKKRTSAIIIIFILILGSVLMSIASDSNVYLRTKIDLKFGVHLNHCKGSGICLIYFPDTQSNGEFSEIVLNEDVVSLYLPYSKVREMENGFSKDYFFMEEEYRIPDEVAKEMGSEFELILPKGRHPISLNDKGYLIEFRLDRQ